MTLDLANKELEKKYTKLVGYRSIETCAPIAAGAWILAMFISPAVTRRILL